MQVNGNSVRLLSMVALSASYVKIKPMNKYSLAALNTRALPQNCSRQTRKASRAPKGLLSLFEHCSHVQRDFGNTPGRLAFLLALFFPACL